MNTLRNKVSLIGRLGAKPEIQNLAGGYVRTKFFIATRELFKDKSGQWQENTQWHHIIAWGKVAELMNRILDKGQEIALEGKLVNRSYESKTGEKRYNTEIEARDFLLLSGKVEKNQSNR
jgi:single-strand DNA-binding protein